MEITDLNELDVQVYPNPTSNKIYFKGLLTESVVDVFTFDGRHLSTNLIVNNSVLDLNVEQGIYLLRISSEGKSSIKKVIVK